MENNQEFNLLRGDARYREAADEEVACFEVTYWDTDCGRVRTEIFDDAKAAERFASRNVADEDGWAVVDPVPQRRRRAAA